jgi:hypothetical protein
MGYRKGTEGDTSGPGKPISPESQVVFSIFAEIGKKSIFDSMGRER